MMKPSPALDEAQRLAMLHRLRILDTPAEQRFDKFVEFAAGEFDVPISVISLIDRDRQWFKARTGLDACETSRDVSFCGHTILELEQLVVEDALLDARFADNPLVIGPPFIRFYAGIPLVMPSGEAIGALCLMDTRPRKLSATAMSRLGILRELVVQEMLMSVRG